jgi:ribosomal protein S18 acetylase RimI-like enzyme
MKEQARIRAFTPEDHDHVVALWRESGLAIKPSDTLPELQKMLALPANVFLIAEAKTGQMPPRIVGTVIGAWDGRRAWIYHLAVKPVARRARIGSGLMSAVEQAFRGHGTIKINLLVEPGNQQAVEFYRALGYSDQPLQFFSKNFEP